MRNGEVCKAFSAGKDDLEKINRYTRSELKESDVYVFSLTLCDNEIDRDFERFTVDALKTLTELFVGKTGIVDHNPSAHNQVARIYDTWVEAERGKQTAAGEPYYRLRAKAYIPRGETTDPIIRDVDTGIKKEVSVGLRIGRRTCSVCGADNMLCEHRQGREYDGKVAHCILDSPTDAYEWSFVAVPAQRAAGVTKSFSQEQIGDVLQSLLGCDLTGHTQTIRKLMYLSLNDGERLQRQEIIEQNKKYLEV